MQITIQLLGQARQLSASDRMVVEVAEGASVDDLIPLLLTEAFCPMTPACGAP